MSGRYARYSDCRDTGVEWLGQVPVHWTVCKFAYLKTVLTDFTANGSFASLKERVQYRDEPSYARLVRLTDLRVDLRNEDGVWIDESAYNYLSKSALFGGEFLLANVGAYAGLFYPMPLNKGKCSLGPNMFMAKFDLQRVTHDFMALVGQGQSASSQLFLRARSSSAQPKLNKDDFKSVIIAYPPLDEQTQIARFLDYETARIDALIDKQQQLIALLQEKRQAVISHAVTKGLNPDAPMRDSGVEWLGKVPAHWTVGRYKFCTTRVVVGIAEAATHAYADIGVPIIRSTNIKEEGLSTDGVLYIKAWFAEQNASKFLYAGDIVTVRTGYPGVSAVVPESLDRSQCFTNLVATPRAECDARFLCEFLNSHFGKKYFDLLGWGSAQKNISVPILQNVPIPWPSTEEQHQIVAYVDQQRTKFSNLVSTAERMVDALQERRTALISAAVTGKIDVRNWTPPSADVSAEVA